MNLYPAPLLAETAGFADAMNRRDFIVAGGLALVAMIVAFLPRLPRVARWLSVGLALVSIYLVIEFNSPLPWSPLILFSPAALSLLAVWQTWRTSRRAKWPMDHAGKFTGVNEHAPGPLGMRPRQFKSDAGPESNTATRGRSGLRPWLWALAGFGLGVVSATAYLLLGGDYFLNIPRWAEIVFYPGFLAGKADYGWPWSLEVRKVVGVLTVGLAYAALATLTRLVWFAFKHRRPAAAVREDPE